MKTGNIHICLFVFILFVLNTNFLRANPNDGNDKKRSYCGKIILESFKIIESDDIRLLPNCVLYKRNHSLKYDSLENSLVKYIRVEKGNYILEGAGLGGLLFFLIALDVNLNSPYNESADEFSFYSTGIGIVIGGVVGACIEKYATIYINKNSNVSFFPTMNFNRLNFKPNSIMFTLNYHF
jgi:hypothetical protein